MKPTFIQPCFIRKNTPELFEKLEELGYHKHPSSLVDKKDKQFLFCNRGMFAELPIGYTEEIYNSIDCGTNEDLFLAVAALREDSDEHQWFIIDVEAYTDMSTGTWFKATPMFGGKHVGTQIEPAYCHKASVEELIEHFKNK